MSGRAQHTAGRLNALPRPHRYSTVLRSRRREDACFLDTNVRCRPVQQLSFRVATKSHPADPNGLLHTLWDSMEGDQQPWHADNPKNRRHELHFAVFHPRSRASRFTRSKQVSCFMTRTRVETAARSNGLLQGFSQAPERSASSHGMDWKIQR